MKSKLKTAAFLLLGFLIGIAVSWFFLGRLAGNTFAHQYLTAVMDQANVALHIRAGKEATLLKNIETKLPTYVLAVDQGFREYPGSTDALWMIKAYYERNGIVFPTEIEGILNTLPPKPPSACQLRLQAIDSEPERSELEGEERPKQRIEPDASRRSSANR